MTQEEPVPGLFPPDLPRQSPLSSAEDVNASNPRRDNSIGTSPTFTLRVKEIWYRDVVANEDLKLNISNADAWQILHYGALQLRQKASFWKSEQDVKVGSRWALLLHKLWLITRNDEDLKLFAKSWNDLLRFGPQCGPLRHELCAEGFDTYMAIYKFNRSEKNFVNVHSIGKRMIPVATPGRQEVQAYQKLGCLFAVRKDDIPAADKQHLVMMNTCIHYLNIAIKKLEDPSVERIKSDSDLWVLLAQTLSERYEITYTASDIDQSISHLRSILRQESPGSKLWISWSDHLARAYWKKFKECSQLSDAHSGIEVFNHILQCDPDNLHAASGLAELLRQSCAQEVLGNAALREYTSRAIELLESAIACTKDDDPNLPSRLGRCSEALASRFEYDGVLEDVDVAISLHHAALNLPQVALGARWFHLKQLCNCHILRFNRRHQVEDIRRALDFGHQSLHAVSDDKKALAEAHLELGCAQGTLFVYVSHKKEDLNDAISNLQFAQDLNTELKWRSVANLRNLARLLCVRFQQSGSYEDVAQGLQYIREAIDINRRLSRKGKNPSETHCLEVLGDLLLARANAFNNEEDINEAIRAYREALNMTDIEHPGYVSRAKNLSYTMLLRYSIFGADKDIKEASILIEVVIDSLKSRKGQTTAREMALLQNQLGTIHMLRFAQNDSIEELDLAMKYFAQAFEADETSVDYAQNVATCSKHRALKIKEKRELVAAFSAYRKYTARILKNASDQLPHEKPEIYRSLAELGLAYRTLYPQNTNLTNLTANRLSDLCVMPHVPPSTQLWAAGEAAALAYAEHHDYVTASRFISLAVSKVPECLTLAHSRADQLRLIKPHSNLPSLALFFHVLASSKLSVALQLFEQARAVLWSRIASENYDLKEVQAVDEVLAKRFEELRGRLFQTRMPMASLDRDDGMASQLTDHYRDAEQYKQILDEIRAIPELKDFLRLPSQSEDFYKYATEGAIVVVNCVSNHAHAVLVTDKQLLHLNLPGFSKELAKMLHEKLTESLALLRDAQDEEPNERVRLEREALEIYHKVMRTLWRDVAKPILDKLDEISNLVEKNVETLPRIWWLTNGWMNVLPIHAAGDHTLWSTSSAPCTVVDRAISSYIPTFSALEFAGKNARAKSQSKSNTNLQSRTAALISMPETANQPKLPNADEELFTVSTALQNHYTIPSSSSPPTKKSALAALRACYLAHFICHGEVDAQDPTRSRLLLSDYHKASLDVRTIMRAPLSNCEMVYLSVCKAAVSETMPLVDEGLHIAGAFLMAGVPYVVGTWWEIVDQVAVGMSGEFYRELERLSVSGRGMEPARSAGALHAAVQKMRREGVNSMLWGAYVHYGA